MTLHVGSEHAEALQAMIVGLPAYLYAPASDKFDDDDYPYVILWVPGGIVSSERLALAPHRRDIRFQSTIVATSDDQARWAVSHVRDSLALQRPTLTGWQCSRIEHVSDMAAAPDDTVPGRQVLTSLDFWHFVTSRVA